MEEFPEITVNWKRPPSDVPFPHVWKEYEAKRKTGETVNIRIQDAEPEMYGEIIEFMCTHYLRDEPLCNSSKLIDDVISVAVYRKVFTEALEQRMTLVALAKDVESQKYCLVGAYVLTVYSKKDPPLPEVPGKAINKLIDIYYAIRKNVNIFEELQTEQYLHDWGLCVAPEYRGLRIGFNMLAVLPDLCKMVNVKGIMTMFTTKYTQSSAEELGYKMYKEIVYQEYKSVEGDVIFPVKDTRSLKLMGKTFF